MMHLSIVGMSGSGKSHWAGKLSVHGFRHICCDHLIAEKLAPELTRSDGGITRLGQWMGFPYESRYREREAKYLAYEIEVLAQLLAYLKNGLDNSEEDIVIDTTGSAIYTGEEILKKLRRQTTVVHLATPPEIQEQMLKKYIGNQRPVLWRDMFTKEPTETNKQSLVRCYPKLLAAREQLYERLSHVTLDYYRHSQNAFGVNDLLDAARAAQV